MINTIQYQVRNYQQKPISPDRKAARPCMLIPPTWCHKRADENTSSVDIMVQLLLQLGRCSNFFKRISCSGFNEAIGTLLCGLFWIADTFCFKVWGGQEGWAVAEQDPVWELAPGLHFQGQCRGSEGTVPDSQAPMYQHPDNADILGSMGP